MRYIKQIIQSVYLFFFHLTPKGKEQKMFDQAEESLTQHFVDLGHKEIKVKKKCIDWAQRISKIKRLSKFHLATITNKKHQKELGEVGVIIDSKTLKFKDA